MSEPVTSASPTKRAKLAPTTAAGGTMTEVTDEEKITTVMATSSHTCRTKRLSYTDVKLVGKGVYGEVFRARFVGTTNVVAIKTMLKKKPVGNNELRILRMLVHQNIANLKYFFYTPGEEEGAEHLNLVLDYLPCTLYKVMMKLLKVDQKMPMVLVKVYMYQLFVSLAYLHSLNICHRDVHCRNILVNPDTTLLKLCDFGMSSVLQVGEKYKPYVCGRHYRAPELFLGATDYTCQIDVWSAGCVLADLLLNRNLFKAPDILAGIVKLLGTPTHQQLRDMKVEDASSRLEKLQSRAVPWRTVFGTGPPDEAMYLISHLLRYSPAGRLRPDEACAHGFFDELRDPSTCLPLWP